MLTDSLGEQMLVDNGPGANGIVGSEIAAKATPEGYTQGKLRGLAVTRGNCEPRLPDCRVTTRWVEEQWFSQLYQPEAAA